MVEKSIILRHFLDLLKDILSNSTVECNTMGKLHQNTTLALAALITAALCAFLPSSSTANDTEIGAAATFVQALGINKVDMNYGEIEFNEGAGGNNITLSALDASLSCSNTAEYTCPGSGTRGEAQISGSSGFGVNISCESSGTVSDGTDSLVLDNTEVSVDGSAYSCLGLASASASLVLTGDSAQDKIFMGARMVIPSEGLNAAGTFSTDNSGGDPVVLRVIYQ